MANLHPQTDGRSPKQFEWVRTEYLEPTRELYDTAQHRELNHKEHSRLFYFWLALRHYDSAWGHWFHDHAVYRKQLDAAFRLIEQIIPELRPHGRNIPSSLRWNLVNAIHFAWQVPYFIAEKEIKRMIGEDEISFAPSPANETRIASMFNSLLHFTD